MRSCRHILFTAMVMLSLSGQACAQSVDPSQEQNTKSATVKTVAPDIAPMNLEEIRAEQAKLKAQIAEIRAKGELERADKIAILKLQYQLLYFEDIESHILNMIIQNQKYQLKKEFASVRQQIEK